MTRAVLAIVAALVAAVCVSSPLHLPLNNPNEGVRVFTVKALVEGGGFAIDDVVRDWGYIDDKAICGDHVCASKAPFVSLVAAAAYAVVHVVSGDLSRPALTRLSRVSGGVVPAGIALAVLWWALRKRAQQRNTDIVVVDVVVVGAVVGSGVLASLNVFSGHALAALAPGAVLALALLDDAPSTRRLLGAGALLSAAACAEYPAALALPLALPLIWRSSSSSSSSSRLRALLLVVVGGFVTALPTMVAHTLMFGAPWRTGYSSLENPQYQPLVEGTFFGIAVPDVSVFGAVFFSPAVGLFVYSPLLLTGVFGLVRLDRRTRAVVVVVLFLFCVFIAGFKGWRGGWSVGPRYISELIGILSVTAVLALERARFGRAIAFVGAAAGVVVSGFAGALFPHLPDVLRNPVVELVLPTIVRGLCPDSVPLWLGLSPANSVVVVVVVVTAPVVIVGVVHRASAVVAVAAVVPLIALLALVPGTDERMRAREVRRMADNWRPVTGLPWDLDDVRVAFAVDHGRAWKNKAIDCALPPRASTPDTSRVLEALLGATLQTPGLVVVDDALADHIAPAGGTALVVDVSDVDRFLTTLPCDGDITVVVRPGTLLPKRLRGLAEKSRRDVNSGVGFVVLTLARDPVSP